MISLRFVSGGGWDSKLIEWETWSKWSHVEIVSGPNVTLGAMLKGGVIYRHFSDAVYRNARSTQRVEVPLSPDQEKLFWEFAHAQIGKPYDKLAIVGFAFRRDWRDPSKWFCSEYVTRCLEYSGWLYLPRSIPVNRISPALTFMLICSRLRLDLVRVDGLTKVAAV